MLYRNVYFLWFYGDRFSDAIVGSILISMWVMPNNIYVTYFLIRN
ncbi:hypothetical protein D083_4456 [Dickeya solani RNS 08.23.3.1.A]|nr:hypothetical protein D083_4456 [Dickeya solani RNS 08.23.3.1.A]